MDLADEHGKNTATVFNPLEEIDEKHTVSYEARELKRMYNKMRWIKHLIININKYNLIN